MRWGSRRNRKQWANQTYVILSEKFLRSTIMAGWGGGSNSAVMKYFGECKWTQQF